MISNHCFSITHHHSQRIMLRKVVVNHDVQPVCWAQWLGIMVCYAEPGVVNHVLLCWASGCESWCVILRQWLFMMMCIAEQVIVNHGEIYCSSGCVSWCAMLSQWFWIMLCYACEYWWVILRQWLWIIVWHSTPWFTTTASALHTMTYNHWLSIKQHDSQPLAQHSKTWFTTTGSA
jgi:hypothetical protein